VHEAVALAQRLRDLGAQLVLHVRDDDRGAGARERLGHALAESLRRTGDQGLAPGQVENRHTDSFVEVAWSSAEPAPPPGLTSVKNRPTSVKSALDRCPGAIGMPGQNLTA